MGYSSVNSKLGSSASVGVPTNANAAAQPSSATVPKRRGCPSCKRMVPVQAESCPSCHHVYQTQLDANGNPLLSRPELSQTEQGKEHSGRAASPRFFEASSSGSATSAANPSPSSFTDMRPFDPYRGLSEREALVMREFARQREQFVWWAIIGFYFGYSLVSLALAVYAIIRLHSIRQNVAEFGVDPSDWNTYESRRFAKAFKPHLIIFACVPIVIVMIVIVVGTLSLPKNQ